MQCNEAQGKLPDTKSRGGGQFMAVRDSRNRRVPGLYQRNGRYYGQIWMKEEKTARKFPLLTEKGEPVETLNEAKEAIEVLRNARRERTLPTMGHKPSLSEYVEIYFGKAEIQKKKTRTLKNERQALRRLSKHLGDVRIDRIERATIASFKDKRLSSGVSARTVNLDQTALRNVLKRAVNDEGYLRESDLLALKLKNIKEPKKPKRRLLAPAEFDQFLATVPKALKKNAVEFEDYVRFLSYSGGREQESLKVRWKEDVDFENERVRIGAGGVSKNHEERWVEFNEKLGALLRDMEKRRAPDCSWLFPSPQRGRSDEHAHSFRESLRLVRKAANLEWVGFHDFRHAFASYCVMAGVDFMTIAAWLGHKDGGILVGKIYGHLLDDHRKQAARKVRFDLAVVEAA